VFLFVLCALCVGCKLRILIICILISLLFPLYEIDLEIFVLNLSSTGIITFIKAPCTHTIHLIKILIITYSLWMFWRMGNFSKFQLYILLNIVSRPQVTLLESIWLVGFQNFSILKHFDINTRTRKVLSLMQVF